MVPPDKLTGSWGTDEGSGTRRRVGADEKCTTRRSAIAGGEGSRDEAARESRAEGILFRESTRTIIRSRAGSSKDPRDDISMPCLRNNFNYPRYTKKNTKSNARNSGERAPPLADPLLAFHRRALLYRHSMHPFCPSITFSLFLCLSR